MKKLQYQPKKIIKFEKVLRLNLFFLDINTFEKKEIKVFFNFFFYKSINI